MSLLSRLAVQAARAYGILSSNKNNVSASYLVVAGGGGGGGGRGSGAGAGGYRTGTSTLSTLNTYTVVVGSGGAGAIGQGGVATSGVDSSIAGTGFTTFTSSGGGAGVSVGTIGAVVGGNSGGSASGGNANGGLGAAGNTPSTSPSQGSNGGNGIGSASPAGGGGGGASAAGGNASNAQGGVGGAGSASSITGSSVTYAGGGGGGAYSGSGGAGGSGGGGAGSASTTGTAGTVNLGGGGGGGGDSQTGGAGGSGVVIISYTSATPKFVGGTLTTSGGNQIHTFTSSGTLSPLTPVTASYLIVAGGGGGGYGSGGGGGGAGGLLTSSTTIYSGATYVVTIGAGGAGATSAGNGTSGVASSIAGTGLTTLSSTGGGAGGGNGNAGSTGGSGGGGSGLAAGGSATSGQGNTGGTAVGNTGGGGGGAGAVGANGTGVVGGNGGAGSASSISGSSVTYAGGGGGASGSSGGSGGGGAPSTNGTANTGGGGGGWNGTGVGGTGGSGTVIISYAGSQVFNGGLVTSSGGNTIHTFNATGALTPVTNNLNNSLRFRASASAYLSRTPTVAGSQTTWTWSAWVKRGKLGSIQALFGTGSNTGTPTEHTLYFSGGDTLFFEYYNGSTNYYINTTPIYRDPSAWYHIVAVWDTTQGTSANRMRLYVNGSQVTSVGSPVYPTSSFAGTVNTTVAHYIGEFSNTGLFDGYMTDINFIDGQALEPYYFGNNDAYGNWKPIKYTGMYGTNGFYLTFGNTTSTTTLGYDSSPNGNNWTTNNISLTAGVTYDAMLDVPTNTSATVANYCVLNPLNVQGVMALTNASLTTTITATGSYCGTRGTMAIPSTGKWYWETKATTLSGSTWVAAGMATIDPVLTTFAGAVTNVIYWANHQVTPANSIITNETTTVNQSATVALAAGDIVQCAYDADTGKFWFGKNNVYWDSSVGTTGNPSAGTNQTLTAATKTWFPMVQMIGNTTTAASQDINFGQRPFSYTPPTGFVALNTYNLPTPTILQGNKYMDATLYTGTGATATITNAASFKPDFVWIKARNDAQYNVLQNSNTGAGKTLFSNTTTAETGNAGDFISSFNSNGFTVNTTYLGGTNNTVDTLNNTYVGWQWQAGQGSTSSNTSGTITSTVSVNTTAGFSVVTYTGTGSNATCGHGLGVIPSMVIWKNRTTTDTWIVYHSALTTSEYLVLASTAAKATYSGLFTGISSTLLPLNAASAAINASANNYVAYCWAEIAGFSKFGSYTGNSSTDGTFVYLGFRPKFVIFKDYSNAHSWVMVDSSRNTYNVAGDYLRAESSAAENATYSVVNNTAVDFLSNGFKLRNAAVNSGENNGSSNYIYMAFAENPFKNSNAR